MDSTVRLLRVGTVRDVDDGCTSIEVSVPCATCRLGCAASGSGGRQVRLSSAHAPAGVAAGETVRLSVAASGLAKSSLMLFGPAPACVLLLAAVPVDGVGMPAAAFGAMLAVSLLLGRLLVRGHGDSPDRAAALLDIRAEREVIQRKV
ncbi:MAG TPA: SoxR reducing system RseC family protein [Pseudomonadales bacterium]